MDLTAKLPLNAKSDRTLLDSMQVIHILYNKTIILKQYTLYHHPIYDAIKELLSNKEIFKYCIFDYKPEYITNDKNEKKRCYSELYNEKW